MREIIKKLLMVLLGLATMLLIVACSNPMSSEEDGNGTDDQISQVTSPQVSPAGGSYNFDQSVSLSSTTEGASIHYTTDGSVPDADSTLYTSPIEVAGDGTDLTIRAIAVKAGMSDSDVTAASYSINYAQVASPQISPPGGSYNVDQSISLISTTEGANIYYTTDGSVPDADSTLFTAPIEVAGDGTDLTIRAIAVKAGMSDSDVTAASYSINYAQVASPQISPAGGSYNFDQSVSLSSTTEGASIHYTTDGSVPDADSTLYTSPIEVAGDGTDLTIQAVAVKAGMSDSDVTAASYSIVYEYMLSTAVEGDGSVIIDPDEPLFTSGTVVTVAAYPSEGWYFSHWSGDLSGSNSSEEIVMSEDKSVTAVFLPVQYTLTVSSSGSGTVSKNPDKSMYDSGDIVELSASPDTGYQFDSWSGSITGSANPVSVTMDGDKSVSAQFSPVEYQLALSTSGSGSVDRNPSLDSYPYGTSVILTANPDSGYGFSHWESAGQEVSVQNPYSFVIEGDRALTAVFIEPAQVGGFWVGEAVEEGSSDPPFPFAMFLNQDGSSLTGFGAAGWAEGPLNGEVAGSGIDIVLTDTDDSNTLEIQGQSAGTSTTGTWNYFIADGTFAAELPSESVNPFAGTWEISFTDDGDSYTISYTFNSDRTVVWNGYINGVLAESSEGVYEFSSDYGVLGIYYPSLEEPYMDAYYYSVSDTSLILDGFWDSEVYTRQ
jgi:DNA-directed RNA polymerase subunit L